MAAPKPSSIGETNRIAVIFCIGGLTACWVPVLAADCWEDYEPFGSNRGYSLALFD
jgi:hypothetical protein